MFVLVAKSYEASELDRMNETSQASGDVMLLAVEQVGSESIGVGFHETSIRCDPARASRLPKTTHVPEGIQIVYSFAV